MLRSRTRPRRIGGRFTRTGPGPPTRRRGRRRPATAGATTRHVLAEPQRRAGAPRGVRGAQRHPQPPSPISSTDSAGSTPPPTAPAAETPSTTRTSDGDGWNSPASTSTAWAVSGTAAATSSTVRPKHPVQAEQPHPLRPPAPPLQVGAAVDDEQPHRVHVPLGRLVPAGRVVPQVHPPPAASGRSRAWRLPRASGALIHGDVGAGRPRSACRALDLRDQPRDGIAVALPAAADVPQHPQRHQQRARLVGGQPQRPLDRLGLADRRSRRPRRTSRSGSTAAGPSAPRTRRGSGHRSAPARTCRTSPPSPPGSPPAADT